MEYITISACLVFLLVLGIFIMRRLDFFLHKARTSGAVQVLEKPNEIHIAFENPVMAASVSEALEAFSKRHPDCGLYFCTGSAETICGELDSGSVDIGIFFSASASEKGSENTVVSLKQTAVYSGVLDCPIEPLNADVHYACAIKTPDKLSPNRQGLLNELFDSLKATIRGNTKDFML